MISKEQALSFSHGTTLYHLSVKDSRGNPARVRVNGKCKTWKRDPTKFELPLKHGLNGYLYLTHATAGDWTTDEQEAKGNILLGYRDSGDIIYCVPCADTVEYRMVQEIRVNTRDVEFMSCFVCGIDFVHP